MAGKLKIGDSVRGYVIEKVLGRSDVATVYLAKDEMQGKKWIVKEIIIPPSNKMFLDRFTKNFNSICKQMSEIEHKAIPRLTDYFIEGENIFYTVREYIEGRFLHSFLKNQPHHLTEKQVKNWALQIFNIMEYLHNLDPPMLMGVVVPKNLILTPLGKIRIKDLGLARFFPPKIGKKILTRVSTGYVAPEIKEENSPPTVRSDIYSLGAILYFFLTRRDPNKIASFKPVSEYRTDVSEETERAIMKALEKDPQKRFASLEEFKNAFLSDILQEKREKLICDVEEINLKDVPASSLFSGEFTVRTSSMKSVKGDIYPQYSWIKVHPSRFESSNVNVKFWIDTSYMNPESVQENAIIIQTSGEKITIPVKVTIEAGFFRKLSPFWAAVILMAPAVILFLFAETFRTLLLKFSWDTLIRESSLTYKTITFVLMHKKFLLKKFTFDPLIHFLSRLYAFTMIITPYFVPLVVGKMKENFSPKITKITNIFATIGMILPVLFMVISCLLKIYPTEITINDALKYLNTSRYTLPFVLTNLITTTVMVLPKNVQGKSVVDKYTPLKYLFNLYIIGYFIYAIYFLVIK